MMKKKKELWDKTDVKIFILYLLDGLRYPMTYNQMVDIVEACGYVKGFDFAECFSELTEDGHVAYDEVAGERYYIISRTGQMVAHELQDTIDPEILKKCQVAVSRHLSLERRGAKIHSSVAERADGKYLVSCSLTDDAGELLSFTFAAATRAQAEAIRRHCEECPDAIYRGMWTVMSGEVDFLLS